MRLRWLYIHIYIYAVPRSLCKDTKGVMEEIRVKQYRIRDVFNFLFILLARRYLSIQGPI